MQDYSTVDNSIILNNVVIGENCRVRNSIIDKHVELPKGTQIGYDRIEDEKKYTVMDLDKKAGTWLTVVGKARSKSKVKISQLKEL